MKHCPLYRSVLMAFASIFLLSSCGFALRGTGDDFRLPFETLYVSVGNIQSARAERNESSSIANSGYFGATLKRQIESAGTKVVNNRKQADASLVILERKQEREVLSLSTAGRVREYALFYTFRFQVVDKENNVLMDPVEIRLRRTLTYSDSQAYAKEKEALMLYEDMENDVMLQVIRRLANIEVPNPAGDAEPEL